MKPSAPAMAALDELNRRLCGHGVDGEPDGAILQRTPKSSQVLDNKYTQIDID